MTQWCTAHPAMTFILAIMAIVTLDNAIGNVCRVIMKRKQDPTSEKQP